MRKAGIAARDAIAPEERQRLSNSIVRRILDSEEFRAAGTVMLYRASRGEVRLEGLEAAQEVPPEEIDLVICPCTAFDENGGRMGMGAGFYDRYLKKCVNAHVVSVAFEVQKAEKIDMHPWDQPMEKVFTEAAVYCAE